MRILPCGDGALLVEVAGLAEAESLYRELRRAAPGGVTDLVPAARTVLVAFDPMIADSGSLAAKIRGLAGSGRAPDRGRRPIPDPAGSLSETGSLSEAGVVEAGVTQAGVTEAGVIKAGVVEIPVRYDGADLAEVARLVGLTPAEVVERHVRGEHRVAFCGFVPGFAYIAGLDPALRVRRRDSPRTRVPAGAVAIADEFSGVYPRESPGGWRLIGHTDLRVFDLDRNPPAALPPGARVRFVARAT